MQGMRALAALALKRLGKSVAAGTSPLLHETAVGFAEWGNVVVDLWDAR